jgi:cation transport regulator ChaC
MNVWVFGYGSLIWRPDFEFLSRRRARLRGWQRRFWQGSHDHRGVPERPGRVVTLVPDSGGVCDGVAYLVDASVAEATFEALDHREKNGYQRHTVALELEGRVPVGRAAAPYAATGVVYVAPRDNHAFLGPAPAEAIARQILVCQGPSGRNVDYLLELAQALRELDAHDDHVFELEALVRSLA